MNACVLHYRAAAYLGLASGVFAAVVLVQFIYLFVRAEVQQRPHHFAVLCLFGVKGVLGMSLGIGAFVAFLGLGIIDSIHHKGKVLIHRLRAGV